MEGKGVRTVTMQYRPSGWTKNHEAGSVGAPGAWPVRPAANAGPGTSKENHMPHSTVLSYVFIDIGVLYSIIPMVHTI